MVSKGVFVWLGYLEASLSNRTPHSTLNLNAAWTQPPWLE